MSKNTNEERHIYTHETCATDSNQAEEVINNVVDMIVQQNLEQMGTK